MRRINNCTNQSCCFDHCALAADVTVTFPFSLSMPAAADPAITAISLLTVPAAKDEAVLAKYGSAANAGQAVPSYLWQHVYSMYGYETKQEVCFHVWSNAVAARACLHNK
jgi:hypothetical protein